MKHARLKYLLKLHLHTSLSQEDMDEMLRLLDEVEDSIFIAMWKEIEAEQHASHTLSSEMKSLLKKKIQQEVKNTKPVIGRLNYTWLKSVAAAVLLAGISLYVYKLYHSGKIVSSANLITSTDKDILLSTDSVPKLIFAQGQEVLVTDANHRMLENKGVIIRKDKDGTLHISHEPTPKAEPMQFRTPKGYTSKIALSDGTLVWLNSNSKLTFPGTFKTQDRSVALEGEAYFEVASRKEQPFYVKTSKGEIAVLGTHFNVNSYQEYAVQSVTLLEGSVGVSNRVSRQLLKPGQQAIIVAADALIKKNDVDVENEVSWIKGYYAFNNKGIKEMLGMLTNWYDIEEIVFQTKADIEFTGTIKRSKSLAEVLRYFEKISDLKFQIQGRRVVVMNK